MQINHNIGAMITQHALFNNNNAMGKSLEKLSTGLKINRAQDDAAGLAMSEQMRSQIRGLGKAKQNGQDGIAALQIAEGGLAEISNMLHRQRELAVQAANDTLTSTERKYLDLEFQELSNEIARISKTTDYNGKNMLNWDADPNKSFGAIGNATEISTQLKDEANAIEKFLTRFTTTIAAAAATAALQGGIDAIRDLADITSPAVPTAADIAAITAGGATFKSTKDQELFDFLVERINLIRNNGGKEPTTDSLAELYKYMLENDSDTAASYTLHISANYSTGMGGIYASEMTVTYISFNPASLGLSTKNVKTQYFATESIDQLENVIKKVSGVRAKIGTYINRLEYTNNNIASLEYNTQDAESRIRDTDFAQATTDFTRNQILVQSATSMLAQANTLPQTALTLIQ